jgi:NTP pyrophosphatase (non-canonical NTP hydrolase)
MTNPTIQAALAMREAAAKVADREREEAKKTPAPRDHVLIAMTTARDIAAAIRALPIPEPAASFQARVDGWLIACFGEEIARDWIERDHRFLEEALELVQSTGCTQSEAHQRVDYVYGREVGDLKQEVGGVMNTLAALCLAHGLDMDEAGEIELARVWTKIEKIRAKQAAKPKHSPLPEPAPDPREVSEAFVKICETLQIQAGPLAYMDARDLRGAIARLSAELAAAREALAIGEAWTEEYLNECKHQDIPAEVERVEHGLTKIRAALAKLSEKEPNP